MTLTAPYDERILSDLTQTIATTATLVATTASGVHLMDLDAESIVLTMDEGWTPHVLLEATCVLPEGVAALDPRTDVRIRLALGYTYPGGQEDSHLAADLLLQHWTHASPGGTISLVATSDEDELLGWVALEGTTTYPVGTPVTAVIVALVAMALGRTVTVTAVRSTTLTEPLTIGPATVLRDVLQSLADSADVWLYCDGLRVWHLDDRPAAVGQAVVQVTTGAVGITTGIETGMSREDWGNVVALEYTGPSFAYAAHTSGPMGTETVGISAVRVRLAAPWPGTVAATTAAQSILRRVISRGASQALTALAAWWVRPGDTITTPALDRVIVSRVRFTYPESLMTITTRTPEA